MDPKSGSPSADRPRHLWPDYGAQFEDTAVAAVYRKRPPYPAETFNLLTDVIDRLPGTQRRLLDVGAGTGEIAIPLAQRGLRVEAMEPSAAMLKIAREQPGAGQVKFINDSGETLSAQNSYDLIVCAQSLHWMDWSVVMPAFAQALQPKGKLAIVKLDELSGPWLPALQALIARYSTNRDFRPFNLVDELVKRKHFTEERVLRTAPLAFNQTTVDFIDSIHGRNGFSRDRMPEHAARSFDEAVRALLDSHCPDGVVRGHIAATIHLGEPSLPKG